MSDISPPSNTGTRASRRENSLESTAQHLKERAYRIRTLIAKSVIELGHELIAAKKEVAHGEFERWVVTQCGITIRTAQRAMKIVKWAGDNGDIVSFFAPNALPLLAASKIPSEVVQQAIQHAKKGLVLDAKRLRNIMQKSSRPSTNDLELTHTLPASAKAKTINDITFDLSERKPSARGAPVGNSPLRTVRLTIGVEAEKQLKAITDTASDGKMVGFLRLKDDGDFYLVGCQRRAVAGRRPIPRVPRG